MIGVERLRGVVPYSIMFSHEELNISPETDFDAVFFSQPDQKN